MPGPRKKSKNASMFSYEFITTNHGDIISCVCMVFMVGLMFKTTQKFSGVFIAPQHNITLKESNDSSFPVKILYSVGRKDICTVFFYSLAWIVVHAIIQEYLLDVCYKAIVNANQISKKKINRKFHLSKTKISRFNNLGGHIPFFFASVVWGADIILKRGLLPKISNIWVGYPHSEMTFIVKFYFILQIAYWVHCFPELYFLKAKKEEIFPRVKVYLQYLAFIVPAYMFNFTHLALVCLVIHYAVEFGFHVIKILNYMGKIDNTKNILTLVWAAMYALARSVIIMLSVATFWIGLPKQDSAERMDLIPNFNKKPLRIIFFTAIVAMQAWLTWTFILYQVSYWSDVLAASRQGSAKKKDQKKKGKKTAEKGEKKAVSEDDEEEPILNGEHIKQS